MTAVWEDESIKEEEDWWRFQPAVNEFNEVRRMHIVSGLLMKVCLHGGQGQVQQGTFQILVTFSGSLKI
jgi:hypothetical protein